MTLCVLNRYLRVDASRNPLCTHTFFYVMQMFVSKLCMYLPIYKHASIYRCIYCILCLQGFYTLLTYSNEFRLWKQKQGRKKQVYFNGLWFLCSFFCLWIQSSELKSAWIHDTHCCWLQQEAALEWLPVRESTGWASCPYLCVISKDVKRFPYEMPSVN